MNSKIGIIIGREYSERVSKKSFIISTILMPLLMLGLMIAPALITIFSTADTKTIAVIDNSKVIAQSLKSNDEINYISLDVPLDSALANADIDGVLLIEESILTSSAGVSLYTNEASSITIEQNITSQIENTIEEQRLKNYDIENLEEILDAVKANVSLQTYRNDQEAGSNASSSFLSYIIGTIMTFMLYIFLLLYGQMVMTSIIEEKNNRVLEIVVSSIKPAQLMMGKIIGIGLVAVTQVLIWAALISVISGSLLPALLPTEVMNEVTAFNNGTIDINTATNDADLLHALSVLGNVGYILSIFGYLMLFLIGGFLFYSSIYAAIGSAVDNIQDAGQFQSIVVFPIIIGLILSMTVVNDPNSTLATIMSMIPFTTPMVMMARIPFGIATWEIIVSLVLLYISFLFMVWVAAKIYRVGIFMYGKKPSIKDLIRWINYK
ncbi:MAG: ABC transporter permease [Muribaculaceae bacterium]|nr:ABC transporter permease [Muribaculaceae bacterium]MBR6638911.1 ABC transporter permease [Muribaculaceae bacterium]